MPSKTGNTKVIPYAPANEYVCKKLNFYKLVIIVLIIEYNYAIILMW